MCTKRISFQNLREKVACTLNENVSIILPEQTSNELKLPSHTCSQIEQLYIWDPVLKKLKTVLRLL